MSPPELGRLWADAAATLLFLMDLLQFWHEPALEKIQGQTQYCIVKTLQFDQTFSVVQLFVGSTQTSNLREVITGRQMYCIIEICHT